MGGSTDDPLPSLRPRCRSAPAPGPSGLPGPPSQCGERAQGPVQRGPSRRPHTSAGPTGPATVRTSVTVFRTCRRFSASTFKLSAASWAPLLRAACPGQTPQQGADAPPRPPVLGRPLSKAQTPLPGRLPRADPSARRRRPSRSPTHQSLDLGSEGGDGSLLPRVFLRELLHQRHLLGESAGRPGPGGVVGAGHRTRGMGGPEESLAESRPLPWWGRDAGIATSV